MSAIIISFPAKHIYYGFDTLEDLQQAVLANPVSQPWFAYNKKTFGRNSRLEFVRNAGDYKEATAKFLMLNHVKKLGIGVFEINPLDFSITFIGVYDAEGNDAGNKPSPYPVRR